MLLHFNCWMQTFSATPPTIIRGKMWFPVFYLLESYRESAGTPSCPKMILVGALLALSAGISGVNGSDSKALTPIPAILRYLAFLSRGFLLLKSARLNWKLPRIIYFGNYICASRVYLSFHPRSSHFLRSAEQVMWQSSVYLHPFLFKNIICITNCTNSCM